MANSCEDLAALSSQEFGAEKRAALKIVFSDTSRRQFMLCAIVHCADLSTATKPMGLAKFWTHRIMEEFWEEVHAEP